MSFPAAYSCRILPSQGLAKPVLFRTTDLPEPPSRIFVEILPASGPSWVGEFEGGIAGNTGVHSTPDPDYACLVARGYGYVFSTSRPGEFSVVHVRPVLQVLPLEGSTLLALSDFTHVTAYGTGGKVRWITERLSADGIEDLQIRGGRLLGIGREMPNGEAVAFSIDLANGKHTGGARVF